MTTVRLVPSAPRARADVSWCLSLRQRCDLELLACGGFAPLTSFLGERDHLSVCSRMRLADGQLWPVPVMLDVPTAVVRQLDAQRWLSLRDQDGTLLARLEVREAWRPDLYAEALAVFGTADLAHPGVAHLLRHTHPWYVAGVLEVVRPVEHHDFRELRHTPAELRAELGERGWDRVVAFQTRNPMHRAHQELTLRAARACDAKVLLHPVVGVTRPGDVDAVVRVKCYRELLSTYPPGSALLSLLPLAMRMAGPREAVWHALIRRNYGATHFILGRDHAGPGARADGTVFYPPYAAQQLAREHAAEIGLAVVDFEQLVYVEESASYLPLSEVPEGGTVRALSGTRLRALLTEGGEIPEWITDRRVAAVLRRAAAAHGLPGLLLQVSSCTGAAPRNLVRALVGQLAEFDDRRVVGGQQVTPGVVAVDASGVRQRRGVHLHLLTGEHHRDCVLHHDVLVAAAGRPVAAVAAEIVSRLQGLGHLHGPYQHNTRRTARTSDRRSGEAS
ncbi:MAG: sat cysC [Frankiales bacterium]|nr:sat cysC [Frankiales bacterium]